MTKRDALPPVQNSKQSFSFLTGILALSFLLPWLTGCNAANPTNTTGQSGNDSRSHLTVTGNMPAAETGIVCTTTFSVSGGKAPYTFHVVNGSLPPGLQLSSSTGTVSGTPTKAGDYSFDIQALDFTGLKGLQTFQIGVSTPASVRVSVTPTSTVLQTSGTAQFTALVSNTSNVAVTWSASPGTITSAGFYQAPAVTANTNATVTATSVDDPTKSAKASLTITPITQVPTLAIGTTSLPGATSGAAYSDTVVATGGTSPYNWTISSGALPGGISLQSSGSLSGTTTQTGTYNLTIQVSDASTPQQIATKSLSLTVNNAILNGYAISKSFFGADFNGAQVWPPTDGENLSATLGSIRLWDDNVKWGHISTSKGVYDWSRLDDWLDRAQSTGMDVLYTFGYTPDWATSGIKPGMCLQPSGLSCVPPADVNADGTGTDADFSAFVTAIVTHAAGRIQYYELWNEPDCDCFFHGTTAQLIRMSKDAAAIIRSLDSQAKILSPSYHKYSMSTKFDDYIAQGGAAYFDIINVHMRGTDKTNYSPEEFTNVYNSVQSELVKRNLTSLPLWDDEHGILDGQGLTDPDMLAGYVARSTILRASVGIQRQYIYSWDSTVPYGLQSSTSGTAWNQVASWLIDHTIGACTLSGTVYTCSLDNGQIVWDTAQTCSRGVCATSSYTYPSTYHSYRDMVSGTRITLTSTTVQIGYKPILLTNQ